MILVELVAFGEGRVESGLEGSNKTIGVGRTSLAYCVNVAFHMILHVYAPCCYSDLVSLLSLGDPEVASLDRPEAAWLLKSDSQSCQYRQESHHWCPMPGRH